MNETTRVGDRFFSSLSQGFQRRMVVLPGRWRRQINRKRKERWGFQRRMVVLPGRWRRQINRKRKERWGRHEVWTPTVREPSVLRNVPAGAPSSVHVSLYSNSSVRALLLSNSSIRALLLSNSSVRALL
ncbi:hypothetical protein NDU88_001730 [Pleurodeles waltl]|uniref:Uncharacterized protein n=1 Tax=Pleurodeles waltl TaxID=8319 RepID=A0AAV7SAX2_PLEWA|nr:hypothetical protein NDU88_001730 [Pleurodeles waltl]